MDNISCFMPSQVGSVDLKDTNSTPENESSKTLFIEGCSIAKATSSSSSIKATAALLGEEYQKLEDKTSQNVTIETALGTSETMSSLRDKKLAYQNRLEAALEETKAAFPAVRTTLDSWLELSAPKRAIPLNSDLLFYQTSPKDKIPYQQCLVRLHCLKEIVNLFDAAMRLEKNPKEPKSTINELQQAAKEIEELIPLLKRSYDYSGEPRFQTPFVGITEAITVALNAINKYGEAIEPCNQGKLPEACAALKEARLLQTNVKCKVLWFDKLMQHYIQDDSASNWLSANQHKAHEDRDGAPERLHYQWFSTMEDAIDCYRNKGEALKNNNEDLATSWDEAGFYFEKSATQSMLESSAAEKAEAYDLHNIGRCMVHRMGKEMESASKTRPLPLPFLTYFFGGPPNSKRIEAAAPFFSRAIEYYLEAAKRARTGSADTDTISAQWSRVAHHVERLGEKELGWITRKMDPVFSEKITSIYEQAASELVTNPHSEKIEQLLKEARSEEDKLR